MTDSRLDPTHENYAACNPLAPQEKITAAAVAAMRQTAYKTAMRVSELLYGEAATIYGEQGDFYLVQSAHDNYVGYALKNNFCDPSDFPGDFPGTFGDATAKITVPAAPAFSKPDIKSAIVTTLSGNSRLPATTRHGDYYEIMVQAHGTPTTAYLHHAHVGKASAPPPLTADNLIAEARRYLGLPYIWGGRSFRGVDCSGLIQQALNAHGIFCPRDSDMDYPPDSPFSALPPDEPLQKGDIVFWKGHVGLCTGTHLLHAYGGTCQVCEQPTKDIFPLLKSATNSGITAIKRIN